MPRQHQDCRAEAQGLGPSPDPGEQIQRGGDLAKARKVMLDQKRTVIAEGLGLYIALDKLAESRATVIVRTAPFGLGTTK